MDKNRVEGLSKEAKGSVKEAIGKLTGNVTAETEGKAEKKAGKLQASDDKPHDSSNVAPKN